MDVTSGETPAPQPGRPPGERQSESGRTSPHADDPSKKNRKSRRRRKDDRGLDNDFESSVMEESMSKEELQERRQAEEGLKKDCIYRMKKKPRRYPTAVYVCKLCDAFIDSISSALKHIKEKWHKKLVKEKEEKELLITLPPPTVPQVKVIGLAIESLVKELGLNKEDLERRLEIKRLMEKQIRQMLPATSLQLYGSSSTMFGFKDSDLNIDIQFPDSMTQPDVLLLVQKSLKNSESFIDVDTDFHARVPVVVCREKESGLLCKVSAGNNRACLTTKHLAALGRLQPSLISLVIAFRYWAKLCHIDSPEEGGLPPYTLALMSIFFLQQRSNPVLPVYLGSWIEGFSPKKIIHFNLIDVENDIVVWEHNPNAVDDAHPANEEPPKKGMAPLILDTEHPCSIPVGQLWVELLRFYTVEFRFEDLVISIRFKDAISRDMKDWPKKRIAIEDPYSVKWNVTRSLNSQLVFEYILHCLRVTYKYFALPHKKPLSAARRKLDTDLKNAILPETNNSTQKAGKDRHIVNAINNQLGNLVIEGCDGTVRSRKNFRNKSDTLLDCDNGQAEEELDFGNEDSDCVTEAVIFDDQNHHKPCFEDVESFNEEYEEDEMAKDFVAVDQGLDDSENGEAGICDFERDGETDSISDMESFPNAVMTESDDGVLLDEKLDQEEESTEGTDELEGPTSKFVLSRRRPCQKRSNSDEVDDEEEEMDVIEERRDHLDSLTADEEVDIPYTVSADDDALSEDEEQSQFITVVHEELTKDVNEHTKLDYLNEEKITLHKEKFQVECLVVDETIGQQTADCDLFYEFSKRTFTKGKSPTVVCSLCKRDGHLKKDCPEDFKKIELDPLPKMTSKFQLILDQVCIQCFNDFSPDALEDQAREYIRKNLENFIKLEFPGATLSLFGSSKNGFGFKQSDLDICMRLEGHETAEGLDCVRIIEDLAKVLRKHSGLRSILPIITAKVPIVKFFHVRSGLEGDISLYNTLALHNTQLLAAYAAFDCRVKYLCYIMKVFTKMCDIGDASRGSLSSYAYTLMVLYFLQQRNPPVIPVLLEIHKGPKKPEILVEGWNVYFFDKLDELSHYWPNYGKNKESVGELWLGLLRFYTEEFDFKEHVICIRRKSLLTTFKKQWTSKYIVIEDPFDLNHNLGAGLSRKMAYFIMKAFMNGRRVFGTPLKSFPKEYPTKMEYFFDPEVLTEGELAPNDRCCRICGKIGHFLRECPLRRKRRRRWENEGNMNQRHSDKGLQRKDHDKDAPSKNSDKEMSGRDGRMQPPCTPPKHRQNAWGGHENGRDHDLRNSTDRWRRQEDRDLKDMHCFICGREGHIKKACPQYRPSGGTKVDGLFGSPSSPSSSKKDSRLQQVMHLHEEKRKQQGKLSLSPHSGSLSSKFMAQGKATEKRTTKES